MGPLEHHDDGAIDPKTSPVVTIFEPRIRRAVLWTVGEVHFFSTPLRRLFPELHRLSSSFRQWLESQDLVFSNRGNSNPWNCFLEGSVQNHDSPGYALPGGVEALSNGQYFVAEGDTAFMLDKICKALRLRGISCAPLEANDEA